MKVRAHTSCGGRSARSPSLVTTSKAKTSKNAPTGWARCCEKPTLEMFGSSRRPRPFEATGRVFVAIWAEAAKCGLGFFASTTQRCASQRDRSRARADLRSPLTDLEDPPTIEDVVVESFTDFRAAKLTCLLSRAKPRDLVDVFFLERAGFQPEQSLAPASKTDAGMN